MRHILTLALLFVFVGSIVAQDASKELKKANKSLTDYHLSDGKKVEYLEKAFTLASSAYKSDEIASSFKGNKIFGKVMNAIANNQFTAVKYPGASAKGFDALSKAMSLAGKKFERTDISKLILENASFLDRQGTALFKNGDFEGAIGNFQRVLQAKDVLNKAGVMTLLNTDEDLDGFLFKTVVAGINGKKLGMVKDQIMTLYKKSYKDPAIYQAVYNMALDNDKSMAVKALEEGRKLFPDDLGLLYDEINMYIREERMGELTGKLQSAIEADPDNASLYLTLGNTYDNIYQKSLSEKKMDAAMSNFSKAEEQYKLALEKKDEYSDALYSLGALYFNLGAHKSTLMAELPYDATSEYDKLQGDMIKLFDQALPYFNRSENLNPNDRNTLHALKEIYARKDELTKSNEYKARLDALGN